MRGLIGRSLFQKVKLLRLFTLLKFKTKQVDNGAA